MLFVLQPWKYLNNSVPVVLDLNKKGILPSEDLKKKKSFLDLFIYLFEVVFIHLTIITLI